MEKNNQLQRTEISKKAQELQKILGELEMENEEYPQRPQLVNQCYQIQKQLEKHFFGIKHKKPSKQNVAFLMEMSKRITKQEEILIQNGQNLILEYKIYRLKETLLALEKEEFFTEYDHLQMHKQSQKFYEELQQVAKYVKNKNLLKKVQKYITIYKDKLDLKQIEDNDPQMQVLKKTDIFNQFSTFRCFEESKKNSQNSQKLNQSDDDDDDDNEYQQKFKQQQQQQEDDEIYVQQDLYIVRRESDVQGADEINIVIDPNHYGQNSSQNSPIINKKDNSPKQETIQNITQKPQQQEEKQQQWWKFGKFTNINEQQDTEVEQQMQKQKVIQNYQKKVINEQDLLNDRSSQISKILHDTQDLCELQQEISDLVVTNGQMLTQIEERQEETLLDAELAYHEIKKAYVIQQENRRTKIKSFFMGIGGMIGFGAFGPVGAAAGGAGGAFIGKGISKLVTDTKYANENQKDDDDNDDNEEEEGGGEINTNQENTEQNNQ